MAFVEMTHDEWDEVFRHHDDLVRMAELELRTQEIREAPRTSATHPPVDLPVRSVDDVVTNIRR